MEDVSSTDETSQLEMSPLNEVAPSNMPDMSVTPDKLGASVALYSMLEAPWNAFAMEDHLISPHWSIEASLDAVEADLPRFILARSPVMDTWYLPES